MGNRYTNLKNRQQENGDDDDDKPVSLTDDNKTIDLEDMAPEISKRLNLPEKDVRFALRSFEKEIFKSVVAGKVVKITGLGTFYPEDKKRKRKKKGSENSPDRLTDGVVFVPAKELTDKLNFLYAESLKKTIKIDEIQKL
jgi:nucleoid DNA-binding protein